MWQRLCFVATAILLLNVSVVSADDGPAVITNVSSHGVGPVSILPTADGYDANIGDWPAVARFGCSFLYVDIDVRDGGTLTGTFQVQQSPYSDSFLDIYLLEPGVTWDPGTTWNESGTERCFRWDFPPGVVSLESGVDAWGNQPDWVTPEFPLSVPLSAYQHQTVRVVFRVWSWGETYDEAIQARIHLDTRRTLLIRAALNDDPPGPADGVELPTEVRVPLGGFLRLETIDGEGNPVPSSYDLKPAALTPGLTRFVLFRDQVLIAYSGEPTHRAAYQAVHKGLVTITITPQDGSTPGKDLTVMVEDPLRLGSAHNDVDNEINKTAHATGVLPQFIKAHIDQESRFNRRAYRYEPLSPWVGDLGAISRGRNLRTDTPFRDYRLATAADTLNQALSEGANLLADDRDARGGLYIACTDDGTGGRTVQPTDTEISAAELVRCNDSTNTRMNWIANAGVNGPARAERLRTDPFTAQTPLAASFGLLQVTYAAAILDVLWSGNASGRKNPSFMFDTDDHHQQDLGSVRLGSQLDVRNFNKVFRRFNAAIGNQETLLALFTETWQLYNPGKAGYGQAVAARVAQHLPVPRSPVLGGAQ